MKKLFCNNKLSRHALITSLIVLLSAISLSAVANAGSVKQSDPVEDGDAYGSYYDNSKSKALTKSISTDSKNVDLKYVRTENLKELPVSKRSDSYGTYDVYTDDNQTEYLFLLNSDIYCGFKMDTVGVATEDKRAISNDDAIKVANDFLMNNRYNYSDYQLISCEYNDLDGYYDIQYSLPISGFKSDDILRLWVDTQGNVTSFSEFNFQRYDHIKIDPEKYDQADKDISKEIASQSKRVDYTIADSYISVDDNGNTILVKVVDFKIPNDGAYLIQRELFTQPIVQ